MMTALDRSLLLVLSCFLLFAVVHSFNITTMLSNNSDFSNLNDYLTKTKLASDINSRKSITVLAVDNGGISQLSSLSTDKMKNILSLHIILDYYDVQKLQKLSNKTAMLTTLFQSSGLAKGELGFLNVTVTGDDSVSFGSAQPGSSQGSSLVKAVASHPYDISVLQISSLIMPQGIENASSSAAPSKAPSPSKAPPPEKSKSSPPPADSPPSPAADSPANGPSADDNSAPALAAAKIVGFGIMLLTTLYLVTMT